MGSLAGKSPASTYKSLLKVVDETNGVNSDVEVVEDGEGTSSALGVGTNSIQVKPSAADDNITFLVKNLGGTNLFKVDASNSAVTSGTTATPVNSQILEFHVKGLVPSSAGRHMFVGRPFIAYAQHGVEIVGGTQTDPDTTHDTGDTADDLLQNLFLVPVNLTVDAVKFIVSTSTDTDCIINVHLMSFDITNAGGTDDGNLTNGTLLANGQATAVDRNVIKTVDCTIDSANVAANKVIACFVENETNTDPIFLQTQVLYHFD